MAYKLEGAKFPTLDELKNALWELYQNKMSRDEFDQFVETNAEEV